MAVARAVPERVGVALPDSEAARSARAVAVPFMARKSSPMATSVERRGVAVGEDRGLAAADAAGLEVIGVTCWTTAGGPAENGGRVGAGS